MRPSQDKPIKAVDTKLRGFCASCHKPVRELRNGSMTAWLFRSSSCACSHPPAQRLTESDSLDSTADNHGPVDVSNFPSFGNQYKVRQLLGQGGMGKVYKVTDRLQEKDFAIKVLNSELVKSTTAIKRFELEAESVAKLDHPNVVAVYGHGVTREGSPYFVMNCVEGVPLSEYLSNVGKLKDAAAAEIFIGICEGLAAAHQANIIHCDLKPTNILIVTDASGHPTPMLVDFGIARVMPASNSAARSTKALSTTDDVFGTPLYMSPEQCTGFRVDARSDIYALGCLMYETMAGKPPFIADNPIQIVVKHLKEKPISWSDTTPGWSLYGLEAIAFKCMQKHPEDRYKSVDELLKDLKSQRTGKHPRLLLEKDPNYVHSPTRVIVLLIENFVLYFYVCLLSITPFAVILATFYSPIALLLFIRQCKHFSERKTSWNNWRLLSLLGWVALSITGIVVYIDYLDCFEFAPDMVINLLPWILVLHMIFAAATFSINIGALLFSSGGPERLSKGIQQFIPILIIILAVYYWPVEESWTPKSGGLKPCMVDALLSTVNGFEPNPRTDSAMKQAGALLQCDPRMRSSLMAHALLEQNKPDDAIKLISERIESTPNDFVALVTRANCFKKLSRFDEALSDFNRVIQLCS